MSRTPTIVWYQRDLRLADHRALRAAADSNKPVIACYLLDTSGDLEPSLGGASRWWLHGSLDALGRSLAALSVQLVLRRGRTADMLTELAMDVGADTVHTCAHPSAEGRALETGLEQTLSRRGVALHRHPGALLFDPDTLMTRSGEPYRIFTPFWKACLELPEPGKPEPAPRRVRGFAGAVDTEALGDWRLRPVHPDWAAGFGDRWEPGEGGAQRRLASFVDTAMAEYTDNRDRPDLEATSRLSPHLHFGELGPRQVWHLVRSAMAARPTARRGGDAFLRELGWREFSHYLLRHWPTLPRKPFRAQFEAFPWRDDAALLEAWQQGRTGYPLVDAGMRQLWRAGWMHNRVRMVAASFLVKHLLVPWQRGAAWFWDTLVDADQANNAASWQWVAGSGADAAPYFRIFNPVLQAKKFDPHGDYVRRWVPELAALSAPDIHAPWEASADVLAAAGVELGRTYPEPVVHHAAARARALAAYAKIKGNRDG